MSDREIVTIDKTQYEGLDARLRALADRIGPANNDFSLHQVLTHLETTLNRIATGAGSGDNTQVLNAINNLNRKVDELMSELSDAVGSIKDDVTRIGDGVKKVLDLLTQPNPDVTNAVAALKEADAGLDAAADAMDAVINPPAQG